MAGFRKLYTSQNEYLYDIGKSTGYFDENYYELSKETGKDLEYLQMMASAKDNISSTFDPVLYNKLSGEEKFNYFATENFMDKSSEDYKQAMTYFKQKEKEIQSQEIYSGLNDFEKTINSIGGLFGNSFLQLGGIFEGLIDAGAIALGGLGIISEEESKEFVAKDTTGYNAAQTAMNDWINQYTFIDKNYVTKAINDVSAGIVRMTPMILGGFLGPVGAKFGTSIYYASMAGNTSEQAITANPDIDYGDLLLYTGASVGLEALTEWASAKLFGDDVISSLMKGQKYAPTGSIIKNIAKNFGTEALEEATSELFGSILYKTMIDPTAPTATFSDILYAAIIGGLTGAVMSGGQVLSTKRMSVVNGKLVQTSTLTKEQKKTAKQLSKAESWGLNNLLTQLQQASQKTDEITKLMSKYGTSLNNIMVTHSQEYQEALLKDTQTKTQQAKAILDLANLMRTIGVEQFQRSAKFLNEHLLDAQRLTNNYFNHTDKYNAMAAEAYGDSFKGQSFTPVAQPTNSEITLARTLREIYPNLKIAFGTMGAKDGLGVKAINDTNGWLFIESGFVDKMGYKAVLQHAIRNELSNNLLKELSTMAPEYVNPLLSLIDSDKKTFSELSKREKKTLAQIICFDPINNRRLFLRNNKTHAKIFKYLTDQAEYVKRFGRQTEANKIRFRDLLVIRDTFIDSIATSIFNSDDVAVVKELYNLSDEEVKTKITDKTKKTILNELTRVTGITFSKESILKREAIDELINARLDETQDFDYNRIYDEKYYKPEWVAQIKEQQKDQDFARALRTHFETSIQTTLEDRLEFFELLESVLTPNDTKRLGERLLTKERFEELQKMPTAMLYDVIDVLYTMTATDVDNSTDSIVITDDKVKGTGDLKFILGEFESGEDILSQEQRGYVSESTREQIGPMAPSTAKYTETTISNATVSLQDDADLNGHQQELVKKYKDKYNLNIHFFKGDVDYDGTLLTTAGGFINGNDVYVRYDGTFSVQEIKLIIEHEATHRKIAANKQIYEAVVNELMVNVDQDQYNALYDLYASDNMYGKIYKGNKALIQEEVINDIVIGKRKIDFMNSKQVQTRIDELLNAATAVMKYKISTGIKFSQQIDNDTQNIINSAEATTPKQIADAIISIVANSPIAYSKAQGFDTTDAEYTKVALSMIDDNFSLFRKVNQDNYKEIRQKIAESNQPYTNQALLIFDDALFTYVDDGSRFDKSTQEAIKNQARRSLTISAQKQGLQSRRLADKTSLTEVKNKFAEEGITVKISDDMVSKYVPETKNKKEAVKQIDENIAKIEQQIKKANDDIERAALNKELKDQTDKRIVIEKGTNEEILDWAITNEDIVSRAAKIQKDVFEQMVEKAELAAEKGKKAVTILVDEKTGLPKPFPKAIQKIQKVVKGLKSFRMWAMLTSPVSWVRNWIGNTGMTVLDSFTNQLEKWMTSRAFKYDIESLEKQQKALQTKKDLTLTEKAKLEELNAQIAQAYDFKFVETTASKELKQQIANEYKDVLQQILNGEDVSKYEGSSEKAGALARAEREITRKSQNANFVQKLWAACQSITDWGLNTGFFGDNAVVTNSLVKNFANMVESNKQYLLKSLTTEYGKDGTGMSAERKALVEKALNTKNSMDIVNAMSKADVELFMDSCKQRTFEQYFKNSNWLSKWASNLSQKHPMLASLTSLVLPFPKVAANIMTMAYKYSPLGFISALRQWSVVKQMDSADYKGPRDPFAKSQLIRTTSQATVGTVMCIAGLILASLGFIDIEDDDYLGPSLHLGDLRISLANLAPSMTTLSVGAAMMWAWKNDQSAALKALDVLYDNTLLGNIENVFRYGDPTKYIENLSINYVSQYVPAMLKLFAKIFTNQETIDKTGNYFERMFKTFASGIPFVANTLPKKINPYTGEFLTGTGTQNVFFNFMEALSPLDMRLNQKSTTQKEAERLNTKTSGLSGTFKVNDKEYEVDKMTYGKYRADYIQNKFEKILSGKEKVTVEDKNGKRITTTYNQLTDTQKKNVIDRLYTEATSMTKIKWWTDQGNIYVVTDRNLYNEYRKMFDNITYKKNWSNSKFVEN